jgi:phage terminase Nu1 subunit (DNA packaging protein)
MADEAPKVMWSIGQIAERDGISKQAVSKIVMKLVAQHGMPVERDGRGRVAKVALAHWDRHRGQFTNPAKKPAREEVQDAPDSAAAARDRLSKDSFDEARRQGEWLKVDAARIERQERLGRLVRADRLAAALEIAGREIQSVISRLPNRADDMATAVTKEGVHGLRVYLRELAFEIGTEIAKKLEAASASAPKQDEVIAEADTAE